MVLKELLLLAAVVSIAAAKVPSYMHVCGARNPKLDECVLKSVRDLSPKLRDGIPELEVPAIDPLFVEKIQLSNSPNFKAVGTNVKIHGLDTFEIELLHVDLAKRQIDIAINFKEITLNAVYNVNARILVPINGEGPVFLTANDINAKVKMNWKLVERGSKKYLYFPTMTMRLNVKKFDFKFEADNFDKTLQEAVGQALGNSHEEVWQAARPNLEKVISQKILEMSNKICKHFTYDELFPDRE